MSNIPLTCSYCHLPLLTSIVPCDRCYNAFYCSHEHVLADTVHLNECISSDTHLDKLTSQKPAFFAASHTLPHMPQRHNTSDSGIASLGSMSSSSLMSSTDSGSRKQSAIGLLQRRPYFTLYEQPEPFTDSANAGCSDPSNTINDLELPSTLKESLNLSSETAKHPYPVLLDPAMNAPFDASLLRSSAEKYQLLSQHVYTHLPNFGYVVFDNFLGAETARNVFRDMTMLYGTDLFSDGQLVKPSTSSPKAVRSDKILWWDKSVVPETQHLQTVVSAIDAVIYGCIDRIPPYKLDGKTRAMLACYPASGTHYIRHVDNPDKDGRLITAIYYLNERWSAECGGSLRLYPVTCSQPVDVIPCIDRLLLFWSDMRMPHEVLPSMRMRFAITVWYFEADEKARAIEKSQSQSNPAYVEHEK